MNYGFIKPEITDDNYVLGGFGVSKEVINETGQWDEWLPIGERQRKKVETQACTQFGTINVIEILLKKTFGRESNYSERFVGIGAKNTKYGNDPHKVAEWVRKNGLIKEEQLPFDDFILTWEDYYSPNPLTKALKRLGKKFPYSIKHEWVFINGEDKQNKIKEALKYSPVGVSVQAWRKDNGLFTKPKGGQDNHWTVIYGYEEGAYWKVFDSYIDDDQFIKYLDWDYDFQYAKLFILKEKPKLSLWERIKRFIG